MTVTVTMVARCFHETHSSIAENANAVERESLLFVESVIWT
jgi:hypothetical protein